MKLIVGLGNPGEKYAKTRHNCGFMAIERLEKELNVACNKLKYKGAYTKTKYKGEDVILLKPHTFMNLSGESIKEAISFFKIDLEDVLVIYDDLALPVGKIRLRESGGDGGHNGVKNTLMNLKTENFKRIRIGIGRDPLISIIDYVLTVFRKDEEKLLNEALDLACKATLLFISDGFSKAMNTYN